MASFYYLGLITLLYQPLIPGTLTPCVCVCMPLRGLERSDTHIHIIPNITTPTTNNLQYLQSQISPDSSQQSTKEEGHGVFQY